MPSETTSLQNRPRNVASNEQTEAPFMSRQEEHDVQEENGQSASLSPSNKMEGSVGGLNGNPASGLSMTGNPTTTPLAMEGNLAVAPMVPSPLAPMQVEPADQEEQKEEKPEGKEPEKSKTAGSGSGDGGDDASTDESTGSGSSSSSGSAPPAAPGDGDQSDGKDKTAGAGTKETIKSAQDEKQAAQQDKKKEAGESEGKSAEEFHKSGKQLDKEQAVPMVSDAKKDSAFQGVIKHTENVKKEKSAHQLAESKVAETKQEAQLPVDKQSARNDQLGHLVSMDAVAEKEEKREPITPESFKKILRKDLDELEKKMPNSEEKAKEFKRDKPIDKVKSSISREVKQANENVSGPLAKEAKQEDPPKSNVETVAPQATAEAETGPVPKPVNRKAAVPKKKNDSEISMENESKSLDDYMDANEVTEDQLAKSNEPKFVEALDSKTKAQEEAKAAPGKYRTKEKAQLNKAGAQAHESGQKGLLGMQGARKLAFGGILGGQKGTAKSDLEKQKEIVGKLESIYNKTKDEVSKKLDAMSEKVDKDFTEKAEAAKKVFEENVEEKLGEIYGWTRIDDWLFGEDTEAIEGVFNSEKRTFINAMNAAIDEIANYIATELNAALKLIKDGKKEAEKYYEGLDKDQKKLAADAYENFNDQYESLEDTVYEKQGELASDLANAYKENVDSLRETFDEIKEKVSAGWLGAAFNFLARVVKTILKIKDLLLNLLSAAIDAIGAIISDPIGFLGNLIRGIKQGFENFFGNILTNITTGLVEWLTGSLGGLGITIPENLFSLSGIFNLVAQILGLTWDYFRMKAVKLLGEPMVNAMEKGFELFQTIREKGVMGLWEELKEQFNDLKEVVMDAIQNMIITKVIEAGIKWILGLMSPAGAFVKAAMMIIDIVRFFVERAAQIFELVQAFIDGIRALASGNVSAVAKAIEKALVKAIPILIGFLAALVGITGLTGKIQKIIKRVKKRIDKAITKIILKAKKAFGKLVKKGKKKVKGAVSAVLNWFGIKKKFKAKDGKSHKLYFKKKGKKGDLIVASKPSKVETYLKQNREQLETVDAARYQKAFNLAVRIRELGDAASAIPNTDSSANKSKLKNLNSQILHSMDRLSNHLIVLMGGIDNVPKPKSPQWIYKPAFGQYPKRASVIRLTKDATSGGTPPDNTNPPWDYFRGDPYLSSHWVQLHLINMKLGGKGIAANLVPGPSTSNSRMEQYAENPLKASMDKNSKKNPKLSHETVLWVDSTVDYYSQTASKNGSSFHFAKNVLVEGGFHFFKPDKKKWVKNKKATFKRNFPLPLPKDTSKPAINLRDDSIVEILELDFNAVNVNRGAFKYRLDLYKDEFLDIRNRSSTFSVFETNMINHFANSPSPTRQNIHILLSYFRNMLGVSSVAIWR